MALQWKSITECEAFADLQRLAKKPLDLSDHGVLSGVRLQDFSCKGPEFDLLFGCQRVNEDVVDALQSLADECVIVEQFGQMRRGAVMNRLQEYPSEERQVLHTASRDIISETPACPVATDQAKAELGKLETFLTGLEQGKICNGRGESFTTLQTRAIITTWSVRNAAES